MKNIRRSKVYSDGLQRTLQQRVLRHEHQVLQEDVEHHVKEEEGEMFPGAKKFLGEKRLMGLGAQLEARKAELERNSGDKNRSHHPRAIRAGK